MILKQFKSVEAYSNKQNKREEFDGDILFRTKISHLCT